MCGSLSWASRNGRGTLHLHHTPATRTLRNGCPGVQRAAWDGAADRVTVGEDGVRDPRSARGHRRRPAAPARRPEAALAARDARVARERGGLGRAADRGAVGRAAARVGGDGAAGVRLAAAQAARSGRVRSDRELLVTRAPGYVLQVEPDQLDLRRFERLLGEGRAALARGKAETARTALVEALALWRGAPLADLGTVPFAQRERARLEELRLGGAGGASRGRPGARPPRRPRRGARAAHRRAPVARAAARPADGGALPGRPPGRRTGRLPGRTARPRRRARPGAGGRAPAARARHPQP